MTSMQWSGCRPTIRFGAAILLLVPVLGCPGDTKTVAPTEGDVVIQFTPGGAINGWPGASDNGPRVTLYKSDRTANNGPVLYSGAVISWKSSNPAVVAIVNDANATTSNPNVNYVGIGNATLTATLNDSRLTLGAGVPSSVTIPASVTEPAVSISVTPKNATVVQGSQLKISVTGTTASGARALAGAGGYLDLSCGDETKCTIERSSNSGTMIVGLPDNVYPVDTSVTVKANKIGTVVMTVRLMFVGSGQSPKLIANDAITINVVEPSKAVRMEIIPAQPSVFVGQEKTLNWAAYDADGKPTSSPAIWSTNNPEIAQIDLAAHLKGMSTGPGSPVQAKVQITVKASETVQAVADVTVYKQVSNVLVEPGPKQLTVGGTQQFTATRRDNNNVTIPAASTPITWSTGDNAIAAIDQNGLVTAKSTGVTTIKATTAEGIIGSVDLTVIAPPVTVKTVVVDPTPFTMDVGLTHHFTVTLKDANGATLPPTFTTITWSTENNSVATTDQSGNVTSKAVGTTRVVATTTEGVAGYSDLTVVNPTAPTIVKVVVTPAAVTLKLSDGKCKFTAKAFDANGNEVQVAGFRWLIDDSSIAGLDDTGLATFKNAGKTTIRAFYGNAADAPGGSASLTVTSN